MRSEQRSNVAVEYEPRIRALVPPAGQRPHCGPTRLHAGLDLRHLERAAAARTPTMDILLVHPEIPHNTGCAARLAAATGLSLHLVEPLGFSLDDRYLKRAGLDYWPLVELHVHRDLAAALAHLARGSQRALDDRLRLFTARGGRSLFETAFEPDDVLCFGSESRGLPPDFLERHATRHVYVPVRRAIRSLNLANVVALGTYVALERSGSALPDNDGTYAPHPDAARDVRPRERIVGPEHPAGDST